MRFLFLIFFILFANYIPSIADSQGGRQIAAYDIADFRIGDSLLDKYSVSFIEDNIITHDYLDNRYRIFAVLNKKMNYDLLQIIFKANDQDYLIHGISAQKDMNFNSCMSDMRNIDE